MRVKRELEGGWFQWVAMPLPALLTIQSGINQLRYATLKGIMAAKKKEIRKVAPASQAWAPSQQIVGLALPTQTKQTQMIAGSPAEAAQGTGSTASRRGEGAVILVVAEQRDGKLNRATLGGASPPRRQLAGGSTDRRARLGGRGRRPRPGDSPAVLAAVVVVDDPALLEPYTPDGYVAGAAPGDRADVSRRTSCSPHTYRTRDFAPALAARLDRPLVTDVIGVDTAASAPAFVRPDVPGQAGRRRRGRRATAPHFVTMQIGAFAPMPADAGRRPRTDHAVCRWRSTRGDPQKPRRRSRRRSRPSILSQAERIVAVGRGIKAQEHLRWPRSWPTALGAELAASRPICDNGWLPMERQVGSSGQTVAPKLYVALGISGAIQHLVGMKGARTIVAINKDADAPIFEVADYGIVGDLFEIVPAMVAELKK